MVSGILLVSHVGMYLSVIILDSIRKATLAGRPIAQVKQKLVAWTGLGAVAALLDALRFGVTHRWRYTTTAVIVAEPGHNSLSWAGLQALAPYSHTLIGGGTLFYVATFAAIFFALYGQDKSLTTILGAEASIVTTFCGSCASGFEATLAALVPAQAFDIFPIVAGFRAAASNHVADWLWPTDRVRYTALAVSVVVVFVTEAVDTLSLFAVSRAISSILTAGSCGVTLRRETADASLFATQARCMLSCGACPCRGAPASLVRAGGVGFTGRWRHATVAARLGTLILHYFPVNAITCAVPANALAIAIFRTLGN